MRAWYRRHAFISFARPEQIELAAELSQSFALDCGSYAAWNSGEPISNWTPYYDWCFEWIRHPGCDFVIIPDVIDGTEAENDALIALCPLPSFSAVPVWHLHESLPRLARLVAAWPRIAIGSSGQFERTKTPQWYDRIDDAMSILCDSDGRPLRKIHGLRLLDAELIKILPVSSGDACTVGFNIGLDRAWMGPKAPVSKATRAQVLVENIESMNSPPRYVFQTRLHGRNSTVSP